jgi:endonuclease/exonuclease/phosphatase family metal-dependent hydrolase
MIRLVIADRPAVLCLQEVPPWAFDELERWSGMRIVADVARAPSLGPLPLPLAAEPVARRLPGAVRAFVEGQANAVLVAPGVHVVEHRALHLNDRAFRRVQGRWLRLPLVARLAWAREPRVCQAVRVRLEDGRTGVVGNFHATVYPADKRLADAEVLRAAVFVDALAEPDDIVILAGDFNVNATQSWNLAELTGAEWGFSAPGRGVDHVLVRGAPVGPPVRWPVERRRLEGALLSDHPPVERTIR